VQNPSWDANSCLAAQIPAFYGTRRFITVFTRGSHWSLSRAKWKQFTSFTQPNCTHKKDKWEELHCWKGTEWGLKKPISPWLYCHTRDIAVHSKLDAVLILPRTITDRTSITGKARYNRSRTSLFQAKSETVMTK